MDERDAKPLRIDGVLNFDRSARDLERAARRPDHAREDLGERRLPGAVLADQRMHLAGHEIEIDIAQHLDTAKGLRDAARDKQRRSAARLAHRAASSR